MPLNDYIDIRIVEVTNKDEKPLYISREKLTGGRRDFTILVDPQLSAPASIRITS